MSPSEHVLGTLHCGRARKPSFWTREEALEHRDKIRSLAPIDYCEACLGWHLGPEPPSDQPARRGRQPRAVMARG